MQTPSLVTHTLEPVFDANSRVLILGTMPSPKSRQAGFYYGHPRNRFWPVMAGLLGEPLPPDTAGRRALALRRGLALWDVLASCQIAGAGDASIRQPVANDIAGLLARCPAQAVFTTGQTAAKLYQKLVYPACGVSATALPSTSPANCRLSTEALARAYSAILPWLEP